MAPASPGEGGQHRQREYFECCRLEWCRLFCDGVPARAHGFEPLSPGGDQSKPDS
jgi:hypothetical protein